MKKTLCLKLAISVLLLSGLITTVMAETTLDTYLGKIEYQDQTLTKASAAMLRRLQLGCRSRCCRSLVDGHLGYVY